MHNEHKLTAERFIRGLYAGDLSVIDELAGDSIVISYPIFQKVFNAPAIRGHAAAKKFSTGFASRWADPIITIHDTIAEGQDVVLVWSFSARHVGTTEAGQQPSNEIESWGGMTLFRFDADGKIVAEIGEESAPGPMERVRQSQDPS